MLHAIQAIDLGPRLSDRAQPVLHLDDSRVDGCRSSPGNRARAGSGNRILQRDDARLDRCDRRISVWRRQSSSGDQSVVDLERAAFDRLLHVAESGASHGLSSRRVDDCAESSVQSCLCGMRAGPCCRRPARCSLHDLVLPAERSLVAHRAVRDGSRQGGYQQHKTYEHDHDFRLENNAMSAITMIKAMTAAAMILTLLHGRAPWTSPVTPLMYTWNGFSW